MKNINEEISKSDDSTAAYFVSHFLNEMREIPTVTKLKICYNLTLKIFRLFTVQGDKKWVKSLIKSFEQGLTDEVNELYK